MAIRAASSTSNMVMIDTSTYNILDNGQYDDKTPRMSGTQQTSLIKQPSLLVWLIHNEKMTAGRLVEIHKKHAIKSVCSLELSYME